MFRVLFTGGCGFIGIGDIDQRARLGHDVVVADSLHPQVPLEASAVRKPASDVGYHAVHITYSPALTSVTRRSRPDIAVHLAAETDTGATSVIAQVPL